MEEIVYVVLLLIGIATDWPFALLSLAPLLAALFLAAAFVCYSPELVAACVRNWRQGRRFDDDD